MFNLRQIYRSEKGFTLLEIVIVLSVLTILSTVGIASFSSGSKAASVDGALNDVVSTLNLARSRAISQVKPAECEGVLEGYKVIINSKSSYSLNLKCTFSNTSISGYPKTLPDNITFNDEAVLTSFFFPILTGSVEVEKGGANTISILGYGKTKSITVDTVGGITVKNE